MNNVAKPNMKVLCGGQLSQLSPDRSTVSGSLVVARRGSCALDMRTLVDDRGPAGPSVPMCPSVTRLVPADLDRWCLSISVRPPPM